MPRAIGVTNGNSAHVRRYLADLQDNAAHAAYLKDQEFLEALHEEDRLAYQELIKLDPEGGEAWFDDPANIPEFGSTRERINLVRARCAFLREQVEQAEREYKNSLPLWVTSEEGQS